MGAPELLRLYYKKQGIRGLLVAFKVTQRVAHMSVVVLEVGAFVVMAKYIFQKPGSDLWYFRRRIPDDVRKHYPGKSGGYLIFSLQTKDATEAAKRANRKAVEQDALWKGIRGGDVSYGPEVVSAALALLDSYDLKPDQYKEYKAADLEPDKFINELLYQADAMDPQTQSSNWREDLPPVHRVAGDLFYGSKVPVFLSEALRAYQELKGEDPTSDAGVYRTRVIDKFMSLYGDLPIDQYSREHANGFVTHLLGKGNKTATVKRLLNSIRPVFRMMSRENELDDRKIFESVNIPNLGDDSEPRSPYSVEEIRLIQTACLAKDDDIRWIVALLSDTGMRVSEAIGLRVKDVFLDAPVPYVSIRFTETRRVKTKGSERDVPLVGASLWAISRAVQHSEGGFIFPRYIDFSKTPAKHKGTYASNTLIKWIRGNPIADKDQKGNHSFRHSVQDRLRENQTPPEIRNAICGWQNEGVGAKYGEGFSLNVMAPHLRQIVLTDLFPTEQKHPTPSAS